MSYSEVISEIENKGFNQAVINQFNIGDKLYEKVQSLKEELASSVSDMHESSGNLDSYIKYAAEHCDKYIVDNTVQGKYILRIIEKDILYEIVKDSNADKIVWNAYKCNVKTEQP